MKIEVLGCFGGQSPGCRVTSILINDSIALDAGSLSQVLPLERQVRVRSVILSHSHIDHTASLPFFIENVYGRAEDGIVVHASATTTYSVRKNLLNNASWPDFTRLPNNLLPAVRFSELSAEVAVEIDGVRFTPFDVNHLVPTFGFLVEQDGVAVIWSSDTGPTVRLWEIANHTAGLQAIFLDTSFDNSMQQIADVSFHLTPRMLRAEIGKLEQKVPILLHHLKPPCVDGIYEEVRKMGMADLEFLEQGKVYEFK